MHLGEGGAQVVKGGLDAIGEIEERPDIDAWVVVETKLCRGGVRHPRRDGQPPSGPLNGVGEMRFLSDSDGVEPLPGERVKRVVDGEERILGVVIQVPALGLSGPRALGPVPAERAKPRAGAGDLWKGVGYCGRFRGKRS